MPAEVLENIPAVEDVLCEVSRMKTIITEAVDDGFHSALRAMKQGRRAAEDAVEEARHAIKRNPIGAMAITFGAGLLIGGLAAWSCFPRRR